MLKNIFLSVVVILTITLNVTALHAFLFDEKKFSILFVFIINLIYCIRYRTYKNPISKIEINNLFLFLFIMLLEFFKCFLFLDSLAFISPILFYLIFITFYYNLKDIFNEKSNIIYIFKSINIIVFYNLVVISLCFLLIQINFITLGNPIEDLYIIKDNITRNSNHFFPNNLSFVLINEFHDSRLSLTNGEFTGISHEPHLINYLINSLFLISIFYRRPNIFVITLYIMFLILSISLTALIVLSIVILFWFLFLKKTSKTYLYFFPILFLFVGLSFYFETKFNFLNFITNKMNDGSSNFTFNQLANIFYNSGTSLNFIGVDSIFSVTGSADRFVTYNYGFTTSILIIMLFARIFTKIYTSLKNIKINNEIYLILGCLYFFLHSLKISTLIFQFPLFYFILFILYNHHKFWQRYYQK